VGATRTYTLPSQVRLLVQDGDTIYIDGGIYSNDATKWIRKNLTFIGLGTGVNRTILRYTGDIPNGKGIFVFENAGTCDNPYLENIEFDGAQVSDADGGNGAGIRFQANNITIKNCRFTNCQNGILEGNGSVTTSNVVIENSEFENNGYQLPNDPVHSGYEHHIYISASADTLIVRNSYFHRPRGQANSLKTRAQRSYILYNLIDEEATGYGSWELNIAQGGLNIIMGNVIIQGPAGANHGIIGYDAATNPLEDFYFINNTIINQYAGNIQYFNIVPSSGINTFKIYNNIFASVSGATNTLYSGNIPGALDAANNVTATNYVTFGFTNPSASDYSLLSTAAGAIDQGTAAGITNTSYSLTPVNMYQSNSAALLPRTTIGGVIDIGAYEYANVSLPVVLNRLQARVQGKSVLCEWQSLQEAGSGHFVVESSADGIHYEEVGRVESAGNSSSSIRYRYLDENPTGFINGNLYYRLKMVDQDGRYTYSNSLLLTFKYESSLKLYPNPVKDHLFVTWMAPSDEKAMISLTDISGRKWYQGEMWIKKGMNRLSIDASPLPVGTYVVGIGGKWNDVASFIKPIQ